MSKTKGLLGALLVAVAFAAVAFSASVLDRGTDAEAAHTPGDVMSIRHSGGDPGPFGGGTVKIAFVGVPFNAEIWVDASSGPYQGYGWEIAYDPLYLVHTGTNAELNGAYSLCAGASPVPFGPFVIYGQGAGCLSPSSPVQFIGQVTNVGLQCIAPTTAPPFATAVALIALDPAEDALTDPTFGTTLIDSGGINRPTSTAFKGPNPAGGTIAQIVVVCLVANDISLVKADSADPIVAPGAFTYTLTVNNPSSLAMNVDIADTLSGGGTITGADSGCSNTATTVTCSNLAVPASGSTVVTVNVSVASSDACAVLSNSATVTLDQPGFADPNPGNNTDVETTNIDCPNLTVTKTGPATATAGDVVVYNIQICNDAGSAAVNVTVSDVPGPAPVPAVHASIAGGACVNSTVTATLTTAGNICNTASADGDNTPPSNNSTVCTAVAAAGATKGIIDIADAQPFANVWLCKPLGGEQNNVDCGVATITELIDLPDDVDTCNDDDDGDGEGCADITCDGISDSSDWDGDAGDLDCDGGEVGEGLGAFEFQIKFDHKIFLHPTIDFSDTVLDDTGRVVNCTHDVVTENWVLFGCTSKADADGDGITSEGPEDNPHNGPSVDGGINVMASITFNLQPDLLERIRPTKDNGLRTDLLDENCEAADTLGSPYNMEVEPNGSNEAPNGGLTDNCTDAVLTVRMLEGDIDLDCDVDVVDDQMIAFRYGATFGILSYDPFFDLEPNTTPTDFDIDIKDLQFVFGRNGSTCLEPIPDQDPQPGIPDP